jgi:hypothetical protein
MRLPPDRLLRLGVAVAAAFALAACSGASPALSSRAVPTAAGPRPPSPAVIKIVEPKAGATVNGTTVHVVLTLSGARVVSATTTNIRPDEGHVHLYVDNNLVSMNYGLEQDIPVHAGTYVLKAELVAADHAPFNPRVWSPEVFFTAK